MTSARSFWTRPRGPLLLSLGACVACVACCTLPLAGVVIGAGAATAIATILEPLAGGLLAVAGVLAIAIFVKRRRAAKLGTVACAVDRSCCSGAASQTLYDSPEPAPDAPIACTADLSNQGAVQTHIDAYRAAFTRLIGVDRIARGFRWRFRWEPGFDAQLKALAEREHACCSFFKFEITTDGSEIVWQTTGDGRAEAMLEELMKLPERLQQETRPAHDVALLKRTANTAGLVFTADRNG